MKNKNLRSAARGLFVLLLIMNTLVIIQNIIPAANAQVSPNSLCVDEPEHKGITTFFDTGSGWEMICVCDPYIKDCCGCL